MLLLGLNYPVAICQIYLHFHKSPSVFAGRFVEFICIVELSYQFRKGAYHTFLVFLLVQYAQEVLTYFYSNLKYDMGQDFLDIQ